MSKRRVSNYSENVVENVVSNRVEYKVEYRGEILPPGCPLLSVQRECLRIGHSPFFLQLYFMNL